MKEWENIGKITHSSIYIPFPDSILRTSESLVSHHQGAVSSWLFRRDATEGLFASGRGLVLADWNWEVPRL